MKRMKASRLEYIKSTIEHKISKSWSNFVVVELINEIEALQKDNQELANKAEALLLLAHDIHNRMIAGLDEIIGET